MSPLGFTFALLVAPLGAAGLVAASRRVRRLLCRHWLTQHLVSLAALLSLLFAAGARGGTLALLIGVSIALALLAGWITMARNRGWGSPSTLPRRWDWEAFDAQFRTHVERAARRKREEGV
jgi:O-antigen/teichoic acid export membrane protein